jgi:hypothetical protein
MHPSLKEVQLPDFWGSNATALWSDVSKVPTRLHISKVLFCGGTDPMNDQTKPIIDIFLF